MNTGKKFEGKRKYRRFAIKKEAHAVSRPNSSDFCPILDISLGGVSFQYTDDNCFDNKHTEHSLLLCSHEYCVSDIPYSVINNFEVADSSKFKSVTSKIKCVKFERLSPKQHFDLRYFIRKNALLTPL